MDPPATFDSQAIEFSSLAYDTIYRSTASSRSSAGRSRGSKCSLWPPSSVSTACVGRWLPIVEAAPADRGGAAAALQSDVRPLAKEITSLLDRLGAVGTSGADINYVDFEDRFRGQHGRTASSRRSATCLAVPSRPDAGPHRRHRLRPRGDAGAPERAGHDALGRRPRPRNGRGLHAEGSPGGAGRRDPLPLTTPDDSLKGIFCAQVVEHLITPGAGATVVLALREARTRRGSWSSRPSIPRSSFALGNHFYADTSHVRPVHPETLALHLRAGRASPRCSSRSGHPIRSLALASDLPDGAAGEAVEAPLESVFGYQDYVIVATK